MTNEVSLTDDDTKQLAAFLELNPDVIKKLQKKVDKAKAAGLTGFNAHKARSLIRIVTHRYVCEMCPSVVERELDVKVIPAGFRETPVTLYTICDECKKTIVLGMAFALGIRGVRHEA